MLGSLRRGVPRRFEWVVVSREVNVLQSWKQCKKSHGRVLASPGFGFGWRRDLDSFQRVELHPETETGNPAIAFDVG